MKAPYFIYIITNKAFVDLRSSSNIKSKNKIDIEKPKFSLKKALCFFVFISFKSCIFMSPIAQAQCSAIPFIQSRHRNTAGALVRMLKLYRPWLVRPNAPKIPSILFVMNKGPTKDKSSFVALAGLYRKAS